MDQLHSPFHPSPQARELFERVTARPVTERAEILQEIDRLTLLQGRAYALVALFRQQVRCGFVLADPLDPAGKQVKHFLDPDTGVTFSLYWNPDRELRDNHDLLIARGVIAAHVDEHELVNRDDRGKPCYLCAPNIARMNPSEILLPLSLAGQSFWAGANFAYVTNNHLTLMNAEHRDQTYRREILVALDDFLDQTQGHFRTIYNGLAGASIPWHEHLHATTEKFPIEDLQIEPHEIAFVHDQVRVSRPRYALPVWVVESTSRTGVEAFADALLKQWHALDPDHHTENLLATLHDRTYRLYVILRDKTKLAGQGKAGPMACFECAGHVVLSHRAGAHGDPADEAHAFESATLATVKQLFADIVPPRAKEFVFAGE